MGWPELLGKRLDDICTISGTKTIGAFTYQLMIDFKGNTFIKRLNSDASLVKFAKKPSATTIDAFWVDPTTATYGWINAIINS